MSADLQQPAVPGSLKRFKVAGFRRLANVEFEPGPLNIIIGPNGVGKTTILDAIEFTAKALRRELSSFFNEIGGFAPVLTHGASAISVEALFHFPEQELRYELNCMRAGYGHRIGSEIMDRIPNSQEYFVPGFGEGRFFKFDGETAFTDLKEPRKYSDLVAESPLMEYPDATLQILHPFRNTVCFPSIFTGRRAPVRFSQRLSPLTVISTTGDQLCVRLMDIQNGDPETYEMFVRNLKLAFPSFDRLQVKLIADAHAGIFWYESGRPDPIEGGQLSDGILRFLWLQSILYHPQCPPVVLLDEPESHFHPELIQIMVESFREASQWTQIIATTQNPSLVRLLDPSELFVIDRNEEGSSTLTPATKLDLESWLSDFSMDELWRLGRLGGRA